VEEGLGVFVVGREHGVNREGSKGDIDDSQFE